MDAQMLVTFLAAVIGHALAACYGGGAALAESINQYLMMAADGGGLVGGCNPANYVNGVLTTCNVVGNPYWLQIPAALQPLALDLARALSLIIYPTGM